MIYNVNVYGTIGISTQFPVKPLQSLLIVQALKLTLSAKCFIYGVTKRIYLNH